MADETNSQPPQFEWQTPKPQFEVGRVLGRTFSAIKNNFVKFGLLSFVIVGLPMFLVGLWPLLLYGGEGMLADGDMNDTYLIGTLVGAVGGGFLYFLLYALAQSVLVHACFKDFAGEIVSLRLSMRKALSLLLPLIGLIILYTFGMFLGLIFFVIPGVLLLLGWYVCIPVLLVEKRGVIESLGRSWELTKGYKRWVLLIVIILWVISTVISVLLTLASVPFGDPTMANMTGGSMTFWLVYALASAIAQAIAVLISAASVAAIYFEIRDLKEGITPESIASVFD